MPNENCIRVKKSGGGNFCIKIPENKTTSDYLVIQKYKTSDMKKSGAKRQVTTIILHKYIKIYTRYH